MDDAIDRVRDDPGLRAILRTARAWGVSPRRFMGWEPRRTYSHTYENGRLIRTVEISETDWDDESRDLAMALAIYEADQCPGCAQPLAETTKPENEGLYVAGAAIRCHYCTASAQGSELYADAPQSQALLLPVELRKAANVSGEGDG